jgi:hypothetical protein
MSTCQIADTLLDAAGVTHDGLIVYAWPIDNTVRIEDGAGALRPIDPDPLKPIGYQYGVSATSAGGGLWSFLLPRSSDQAPTTTEWLIRLPDGKTYRGVPPNGVGPYTINDLLTAGWSSLGGVATPAAFPGEVAGEITLTDQDYYDFAFPGGTFSSDKYTVNVGLQECQAGTVSVAGGSVSTSWTNRSRNGIRILFSDTYSGIMTFRFRQE